jgi:hypothetical protein
MSSSEKNLADRAVSLLEIYVTRCEVLEGRAVNAEAVAIVSAQKQREAEQKLREAMEEIERLRREVYVAWLHSDLSTRPFQHVFYPEEFDDS